MDIEIVYCCSCKTYIEDLEGSRQPDYEGHCPKCGEQSNWDTITINSTSELLDLLNDK